MFRIGRYRRGAYDSVRAIMDKLYPRAAYVESATRVSEVEFKTLFRNGEYSPTYGELTFEGTDILLQHGLSRIKTGTDPVLVDLGSGVGKICIQAALSTHRFGQIIGIELSASRHKAAVDALTRLKSINPVAASRVTLVNGDILNQDLGFGVETLVFCANLTFTSSVLERIRSKCSHELHPGSLVYSQREFHSFPGLSQIEDLSVPTSWSVSTPLKVYMR